MDVFFFLLQDPAPSTTPAPAPSTTSTGQPADPAQSPQASPGGGFMQMLPMLAIMFVVFYFLMLRPQRKQQKEREKMIANMKKNDHVITSFGLYGIVKQARPEDKDIVLCIDEAKDVRIRVSRASIAGIEKASGAEGEPKPETQEKAKA